MDLRRYLKIVKEEEIARRYFVMNSFDGALTILGIVIAVYISGERNTTLIIISSLGAAIAMAVSGIWGAYSIERAERQRSLRELEMHLLSDLDETEIERKVNITTILVALVDGFSPLLVSIVTITPFLAFSGKAGSNPSKACFARSLGSIRIRYFPGRITSVSTLFPNFTTGADTFMVSLPPLLAGQLSVLSTRKLLPSLETPGRRWLECCPFAQ